MPRLPDDLKGQLWVAAGIPIGLGVLARAAAEIEKGLTRRRALLADLGDQIVTAAAELTALRGAIVGERFASDPDRPLDELPTPDALCIAPGCKAPAPGSAWHCAEHAAEPAEVTADQ